MYSFSFLVLKTLFFWKKNLQDENPVFEN